MEAALLPPAQGALCLLWPPPCLRRAQVAFMACSIVFGCIDHPSAASDSPWSPLCLPQVLAMELDPDKESAPEVEALLDEIRSAFPSCELDLYGDLDFYPEYSGQAESL